VNQKMKQFCLLIPILGLQPKSIIMSHLMYFSPDFFMLLPALYLIVWVAIAWLIIRWMIQMLKLKREGNDLLRDIIESLNNDERK
jgi:hypothetical protein